jgi:nicotinamide-nucleotide amidase
MSDQLFEQILIELEAHHYKLAIAESLTGGLLSSKFVSVAGASRAFLGSVIAYQDTVKQNLLGVSAQQLEQRGAVSAEVAVAMAAGAAVVFARETGTPIEKIVALATTGMASPVVENSATDSPETKPAGLVFVAVQLPGRPAQCRQLNLSGGRNEIREAAAEAAAQLLQVELQKID